MEIKTLIEIVIGMSVQGDINYNTEEEENC